jgi:hypothetical protein
VVNPAPGNSDSISHKGNMKWENRESIIRTYFKTTKAGDIKLALRGRVSQGVSEIRFGFGSSSQSTVINNSEFKIIPLGTIKSVAAGYHYLDMQGI